MKKTCKLAVSLLLSILMLITAVPIISAAAPPTLCAVIENGEISATVNWWENQNGDDYCLFLPSFADKSAVKLSHNFSSFTINGQTVSSNQAFDFSPASSYDCVGDGTSYKLTVMQSKNLPAMFIDTESGNMNKIHANKEYKEAGDMSIITEDGTTDYSGSLEHIKGRGNSTWRFDKRPYNLKLSGKASLLGMDSSKKWCLLANAQDYSMLRNKILYDMAISANMEYSPSSDFVDLYTNGEYVGTYQLTQKVELGKNQLVKITDLQDLTEKANPNDLDSYSVSSRGKSNSAFTQQYYNIPNNPADITGGYLLEIVYTAGEPSYFITDMDQHVDVKSPEFCSEKQMDYISNYYNDFEQAVASLTGKNSKGKHYTEYIDLEDAAKMFAIQEFSMNVDAGITSCFLYKESDITGDGKLHFSPVWDFDVALGNLGMQYGVDLSNPEQDWINNSKSYMEKVFQKLYRHSDFVEEYESVWQDTFMPLLDVLNGIESDTSSTLKNLTTYTNYIEPSTKLNYTRWPIKNPLVNSGLSFQSNIGYLNNFITLRTQYMNAPFMPIEEIRTNAINAIDNYIGSLTQSDYTQEEWSSILSIAEEAKTEIEIADNYADVTSIKNTALNRIKYIKGQPVYFDNNRAGWDKVYLEYFCIEDDVVIESGERILMQQDENGLCSLNLPASSILYLTFTNGSGEKRATISLMVEADPHVFILEPSFFYEIDPTENSKHYPLFQMPLSDYSPGMKYTLAFTSLMESAMYIINDVPYNYSQEDIQKLTEAYNAALPVYYNLEQATQEEIDAAIAPLSKVFVTISYIHPLYGDVDKNGEVEIDDVLLLQKHVAKLVPFDDYQMMFGDVNGDGTIDIEDALLISKHVAKLISYFPAEQYIPPVYDPITVYFDNTETQWTNVNCYYYFHDDEWPGVAMEKVEENLYKLVLPTDFSGGFVIFNGSGNQFPAPMEEGYEVYPGDIVLFKDGELTHLDELLD